MQAKNNIKTPDGKTVLIRQKPSPPDPEHPKRIYDTFFSSVASVVEQHANKRVLVRDRLLCHLGSLIFGIRFERGHDVYQLASSPRGRASLCKRLAHAPTSKRLFAHYAIKTWIKHSGAYIGCHQDSHGGMYLGTQQNNWRKSPNAMCHALARFVWDNLGDIPSAPRQGRAPAYKHTRTTCVDVFLYLLVDLYPAWRPMLHRRDTWTDFCPNFNTYTGDDTIQMRENWYNSARLLYLLCEGGQFYVLYPRQQHTGGMQDAPSRFRLRQYNPDTHTNKPLVPCFKHVPSKGNTTSPVYELLLCDMPITSSYIYMVTPGKDSQRAFDLRCDERLFIYAMRPTKDVWVHYKKHCIEYQWQAPGKTVVHVPDHTEWPAWLPNDTEHVMIYTSHESRTGIWPTFKLIKDTVQLVLVIADTRETAHTHLETYYPSAPRITLPDNAVF